MDLGTVRVAAVQATHAKRTFDVVGHYGRSDVLAPGHDSPPTVAPSEQR